MFDLLEVNVSYIPKSEHRARKTLPYFHAVDACNEAIIPIILLEMLNAWPAFFRTIYFILFFFTDCCYAKGRARMKEARKNWEIAYINFIQHNICSIILTFIFDSGKAYIYRYLYPKGVILTQKLSRYPDVWILSMCENSFFSFLIFMYKFVHKFLLLELSTLWTFGVQHGNWGIFVINFPTVTRIFKIYWSVKLKNFVIFRRHLLCGLFVWFLRSFNCSNNVKILYINH